MDLAAIDCCKFQDDLAEEFPECVADCGEDCPFKTHLEAAGLRIDREAAGQLRLALTETRRQLSSNV